MMGVICSKCKVSTGYVTHGLCDACWSNNAKLFTKISKTEEILSVDQQIRIAALDAAIGYLSSPRCSIKGAERPEFLDIAKDIEHYIKTGEVK